jgi:hypothetical protein
MLEKIFAGLLGSAIGAGAVYLLANNDFVDGRLSACKDMVGVMNAGIPMQLECIREGGEVYISTPLVPDLKYTLDGKEVK